LPFAANLGENFLRTSARMSAAKEFWPMHCPDLVPGVPPEAVHVLNDPASGLEGVIVLHSTRLGPAAGGCRLWSYRNAAEAATDALRLAEGMAYKNALADLPLGGGKAVIRRPEGPFDRAALFAAFGREVAALEGDYVTAEDVGTSVADMDVVRHSTSHVAGLTAREGCAGGDPSPWTALGVFSAMQEGAKRVFGSSLSGARVAVQGLGHVGSHLCDLLNEAGAELVVADIREDVAAAMAARYGAHHATAGAILAEPCDILAPCALGAVMDAARVETVRARLVCGAANNVLATDADGLRLAERGVLYCPDYVVNAGGIINVCAEYLGWSITEVEARVMSTGQRLGEVLDHSDRHGLLPHRAADRLARAVMSAGRTEPAAAA
jgi:leucine dehydrogenase